MAAALIGLTSGAASASGWPPLKEGAYLYSGPNGTGTVTVVDLTDRGTCHALSQAAVSAQVASGFGAVELYDGANCDSKVSWATSSLSQTNLPWAMLSYRAISA
ncbi:hypothetical protein ACIQB5_47945 [Streptomyces sp. NPDC088560]|uniref:hypothetical protein n=1 Tax=Streptomyces sp. NPDC088560 TaxID=3365868 RepID=UPI0037F51670